MSHAPLYVDTHCHLDRYDEPTRVLARARAAGVAILAVTERPSDFPPLRARVGASTVVRVAVGLHPLRARDVTPQELRLFDRLVDEADYVGEVGLDFSAQGRATRDRQLRHFEHVLAHPRIRSRILTVHSRGAEAETIGLVAAARAPAILHWYSGALKHLDDALSAGACFSVNATMVRGQKGRRLLAALPPDRVLVETDGPYTHGRRGPHEPRDLPALVASIARLWNADPLGVRAVLAQNLAALRGRRLHAGATSNLGERPIPSEPATRISPLSASSDGVQRPLTRDW